MRGKNRDAKLALLILNGNESTRRALEEAAEETDRFWSITSMADARFALEHIWACNQTDRKTMPDVVVADLRLPGLSGVQFTRELRRFGDTSSIFVAFLAAYGGPIEQDQAESAGCDFFIGWPDKPAQLPGILNSIANRCVAKATVPAKLLC